MSLLRRKAVWIPAAAVGVVALLYVAAFAYVGGDVPRGTTVRGVDIGGMTLAAAEHKLDDELGDEAKHPVQVTAGGKQYEVDPAEVDLTFDAKATAEAAGHRSPNPVRLAGQVVSASDVDPVVRVDKKKLANAVAGIAADFDQPVREGKVSFDGLEPVTTMPRGGRVINNGSISAHVPRPRGVAYTATKHAITGLTRSIALDGRAYDIACGQIDIGNAATEMTEPMAAGVPQADGSVRPEPRFDAAHAARAVTYMASLPLDTNVQFLTITATTMPYVGRG